MNDFNFISFKILGDKRYCLDIKGENIETKENIWLTLNYLAKGITGLRKLKENKDGNFFKKETEININYCINVLGIDELK